MFPRPDGLQISRASKDDLTPSHVALIVYSNQPENVQRVHEAAAYLSSIRPELSDSIQRQLEIYTSIGSYIKSLFTYGGIIDSKGNHLVSFENNPAIVFDLSKPESYILRLTPSKIRQIPELMNMVEPGHNLIIIRPNLLSRLDFERLESGTICPIIRQGEVASDYSNVRVASQLFNCLHRRTRQLMTENGFKEPNISINPMLQAIAYDMLLESRQREIS